jgi:hypothetical protein
MPAINRTSIISGPARVTFGGQQFWSKGDVTLNVINDRFNIETAHFGKVDERFSGRRVEVSFEPSGRFTAALAAVLWPYGSTAIGASIFTGSDVPLTINSRDGRQIVVHAAAITQMPQIRLGVTQTISGSMQFTGVVKNATDPSAAGAYLTESAVTYPGDSGFDVDDIITAPYLADWGAAAPWVNFLTEGGWTIDFSLSFANQTADGIGIVDMTLAGLDVTASCVPVGPTAAQILAEVAPNASFGTSIASGDDLVIAEESDTVGSPIVTLSRAALVESGLVFGREAKRIGQTQWVATREIGSALFSVAAVPEPDPE